MRFDNDDWQNAFYDLSHNYLKNVDQIKVNTITIKKVSIVYSVQPLVS